MRRVNWFRGITVAVVIAISAFAVGALLGLLLEPVIGIVAVSFAMVAVGAVMGHFGMRLTKPWWFPPTAPPVPVKQWTEDQL